MESNNIAQNYLSSSLSDQMNVILLLEVLGMGHEMRHLHGKVPSECRCLEFGILVLKAWGLEFHCLGLRARAH